MASAFPIKALAAGLVISILLLAGLGLHLWNSNERLQSAQDRDLRLEELTGVITHLDEVLTMSARMAAATGDPKWEARYLEFEPQLDAAIQETKRLAPTAYASGAAVQTDTSNVALVKMEHHAFDLIRAGDQGGAAAVLFSPAYEEQKRLYAQGNGQVDAALKANGASAVTSAEHQWLFSVAAIAAPAFIILWLLVLLSMNKHVTARRRAEDALVRQARSDPLTGALNHGAIVEELEALAARTGMPCAVVMADIDGLKATNDTYGHLVGDAALIAVAGCLSTGGAIVGRYGGDEFVVLLPGADRVAAERYCAQVKTRLADASQTDLVTGARVPLAASVGVAVYPQEAQMAAQLIKLADDAMYAQRRQRPLMPPARMAARGAPL